MEKNIENREDITAISKLLHDAVFCENDFYFDKSQRVFCITVSRFMWEKAERKGLLRKLDAPLIKSKFELTNVSDCIIKKYEELSQYELSSIELNKSTITIYTAVGIEIELIIGQLKGRMYDIE